jgi:hypothetical protein
MSRVGIVLLVPPKDEYSQTKKIRCKGVIVRVEPTLVHDSEKPHYNIAVFFTNISKRDQKVLEEYVNSPHPEEAEIQINR